MVNLVIVSHSARLGEGVGELARQMLINDGCKLAIAAGIDDPDSPIGTDPIKVMEAIESVADTDHVLVMMDIGSALLSAETAPRSARSGDCREGATVRRAAGGRDAGGHRQRCLRRRDRQGDRRRHERPGGQAGSAGFTFANF